MSGVERRIPLGPLVGTIGAAMLVVSLFLDWWEELTAFTAFETLDLVLLVLALGTALALVAEAGIRVPETPASSWALPLAVVALLIVLSQIVNDPPLALGDPGPGHDTGIWLALAGATLMTVGAIVTGSRISLAVDVRRRERPASEADTARPDPSPSDDPAAP